MLGGEELDTYVYAITFTTKDMDTNENIVARLKQWMEDEGI